MQDLTYCHYGFLIATGHPEFAEFAEFAVFAVFAACSRICIERDSFVMPYDDIPLYYGSL